MQSKTLILVLAAFFAMGFGMPVSAGSGPNLYDPGDVDPWGGDNHNNDDGDGTIDPGEGVLPIYSGTPTVFIRIAVECTWLMITGDIRKMESEIIEREKIDNRLETTSTRILPIGSRKGTRIR